MKKNLFLAKRLREVFLDGKWIANTNFKEQVANTTWQQATKKIGNLNTIALITFHINYYLDGLLKAFDSGRVEISDKNSFDLQPITSKEDWDNLVSEFIKNAENFSSKVEQMNDSIFEQPFIDEKYGNYLRNIEGVIEHSYYHLGQISLIKKMLTE